MKVKEKTNTISIEEDSIFKWQKLFEINIWSYNKNTINNSIGLEL